MRKLTKDSLGSCKNDAKNSDDSTNDIAAVDNSDDDGENKLDTESLCAELVDKERRQCKNKQKECLDQLEISSNEIEKVLRFL